MNDNYIKEDINTFTKYLNQIQSIRVMNDSNSQKLARLYFFGTYAIKASSNNYPDDLKSCAPQHAFDKLYQINSDTIENGDSLEHDLLRKISHNLTSMNRSTRRSIYLALANITNGHDLYVFNNKTNRIALASPDEIAELFKDAINYAQKALKVSNK